MIADLWLSSTWILEGGKSNLTGLKPSDWQQQAKSTLKVIRQMRTHTYTCARRACCTPKEVVCEFTLCPVSADNEAVCGDQSRSALVTPRHRRPLCFPCQSYRTPPSSSPSTPPRFLRRFVFAPSSLTPLFHLGRQTRKYWCGPSGA